MSHKVAGERSMQNLTNRNRVLYNRTEQTIFIISADLTQNNDFYHNGIQNHKYVAFINAFDYGAQNFGFRI